jgi:hypothetical protein
VGGGDPEGDPWPDHVAYTVYIDVINLTHKTLFFVVPYKENVEYIFVSIGIIIICGLYKITLSD